MIYLYNNEKETEGHAYHQTPRDTQHCRTYKRHQPRDQVVLIDSPEGWEFFELFQQWNQYAENNRTCFTRTLTIMCLCVQLLFLEKQRHIEALEFIK